ncbi:mycothione reductase [Sediminivirga luteola]|uniref:Mycothione reductase n=1 Tax=Sediminivirga luteola TaxID=1774748 RepID=A0A8J2XLJ9_9MICO|nr:mycothione reductase [Sediminivirga luteola]MCI2263997.1 mycothione reductase [Sediminivirga luteola]GGA23116.1 mycothione reductase [Sediminivirga luteola]
MSTAQHADLAIIGAGSGNTVPGEDLQGRTVLFERGLFGGTCLNAGCIPSKMLVKAAEAALSPADAARLGVELRVERTDWPGIRDRVFDRIDRIEAGGREYRQSQSPQLQAVTETVRFTGPRRLVTDSGAEWTADRIVIAAGARPVVPAIPGLDPARVDAPDSAVCTSETLMRRAEVPGHATIVGGGYVAMEMAHVLQGLGSEVTVLVRSETLLRGHDAEIRRTLGEAVQEHWDVRFGTTATKVTEREPGAASAPALELELSDGGVLATDLLLLAAGRTPNTDQLGLAAAGYDLHLDGRLAVDEYQRVLAGGEPQQGVYALGDICSPFQLKHVANHEARVVTANLQAERGREPLTAVNHRAVPSAVFSSPQIASVGLTEEDARAEHRDVLIARHDYADVAYGWALEEKRGFVKLVATADGSRLLGAHILGPDAASLLQPLIGVIALDLDPRRFVREQYWIHPALPEVVENALLKL